MRRRHGVVVGARLPVVDIHVATPIGQHVGAGRDGRIEAV